MAAWIGVAPFNVGAALFGATCAALWLREHLRDRTISHHPTARQDHHAPQDRHR